MDAKKRRELLMKMLQKADIPVKGTSFARELGVSRQIIVGDIAILRAAGINIYATPQGYVLPALSKAAVVTAQFACQHEWERIVEELTIIVDNGGKVLDVMVEHPVYGELRANLMLSSRRDIAEFVDKLVASGAEPLYTITGGVHLHTVEAVSTAVLAKIRSELSCAGIIIS